MTVVLSDRATSNNHLRRHGVDSRPVYFVYSVPSEDGTGYDWLIEADFFTAQNGDPLDLQLSIDCLVCRMRRKLTHDIIGGVVMDQPVWDDLVLGSDDEEEFDLANIHVPQEKTFVRGKFHVKSGLKDFDVLLDQKLDYGGQSYGPIVAASPREPWTCPFCVEYAQETGDDRHIFSVIFTAPGRAQSLPGLKIWNKRKGERSLLVPVVATIGDR